MQAQLFFDKAMMAELKPAFVKSPELDPAIHLVTEDGYAGQPSRNDTRPQINSLAANVGRRIGKDDGFQMRVSSDFPVR